MPRQITVQLGDRSYPVRIGGGMLTELGTVAAALGKVSSVVVIADSTVAGLVGQAALEALRAADLEARMIEFPAGEAHKTLATCGRLYDSLFALSPAVDRRAVIVALGGGVTGDMAGFVAATALRGLRWVQCPTTLLADVDASVGGKTAIDHPAGKNLIGAFHQPSAVLIDTDLLKSLAAEQISNGLAECVKHAVIADAELLEFMEDHARDFFSPGPLLEELIARNIEIKARIVSADEREAGQRELLNFGHTIGHAIEALDGFGAILHGQAVSLGIVAACRMAVVRKMIEPEAAARVASLLARLHLPVSQSGLDARKIWDIMQHDKKNRSGQVRMVLPVMLGAAASFEDITQESVEAALAALR